MTTTSTLTPLAVIRAAVTVTTARGYYQPLSRQWEPAIPTAMDVEALLYGWDPHEPGDPVAFARAATDSAPLVPAVLRWAADPGPDASDYRAKLARLAAADTVTSRDIPLLVSAVEAWRRDQRRTAYTEQAAADAAHSRHQGEPGERIARRVTVAVVITQPSRTYGYRTQRRYLIKMRDASGSVYVWEARPGARSMLPEQGAEIEITGRVDRHTTYKNAAQTYLTNCRWKPAPQATTAP